LSGIAVGEGRCEAEMVDPSGEPRTRRLIEAIMSYMFEVYYPPPADPTREAALTEHVSRLGGRLDYREAPAGGIPGGVCLTFEFHKLDRARIAAEALRQQGEHVEGPVDYGP